jgi:hypothetical protein
MKSLDIDRLRLLGRRLYPVIRRSSLSETDPLWRNGYTLLPFPCPGHQAQPGDLRIIYATQGEMIDRYYQALRILHLDDEEERLFQRFDRLENFRSKLENRLARITPWRYAASERNDVKKALTFLRRFLSRELPYGTTRYIPKDQAKSFLNDTERLFGVAEVHICTDQMLQPLTEELLSSATEPHNDDS